MAVEPSCFQAHGHTLEKRQGADWQTRSGRRRACQPGLHLPGGRRASKAIVERLRAAIEDHALSPGQTDRQARADVDALPFGRYAHLAGVHLGECQRPHLAEYPFTLALQHHVAADP